MVALLRTSAVILAATGCALTHRVPTDIKLRGESLNSRLFAGRLRQSASGRGSISCDSAKWAQLRTLGTRAGLPAYTEAPQLISAAAARYLLGAPSAVWESKTTFASPIASLADTTRIIAQTHFIGFELDRRTTATPIPLPPGVRVAFAPFAVALPNGSLHVIWASPSSQDTVDTPKVVWEAIYTSGRWSKPDTVFSASELEWTPSTRPQFISERGRLHVVFTSWTRGKGSAITYLRYENGKWRLTRTPVIGLSGSTIAILSDDSLAIAYAATDASAHEANGTHLYYARVAQRDSIWPRGALVQWRGLGGVREPRIFVSRDASLEQSLIVWAGSNPRTRAVDTLFVSRSTDLGRAWQDASPFATKGDVRSVSVGRTSDNAIHAIYTTNDVGEATGNLRVAYATWRHDHWHAETPPTVDLAASVPTLTVTSTDSLFVVWGVARPANAADRRAAPISEYSIAGWMACSPRRSGESQRQ
jgi:hypothetical protein